MSGPLQRPAAGLALGLVLAACAGKPPPGTAAASDPAALAEPASMLAVDDPLETYNRAAYRFNYEFDTYIFLPIVRGYRFVVPAPVRDSIANFFSNLGEIRNAGNGLLQARPEVASRAVIRFAVNSTIGLLGLLDVASELGVEQQREDFGQTLGWWGLGAGPYIVLPFLGPSSLRDTAGLPVDFVITGGVPPGSEINEVVYANPAPYGLEVVNLRETNDFRYYMTGSAFEYDLVRFLYLTQRRLEVQR